MNNVVHGLHVPYIEIGHQSTYLTWLPDTVCDVQLSRAAHQLLGRLYTLSFRPSGEH